VLLFVASALNQVRKIFIYLSVRGNEALSLYGLHVFGVVLEIYAVGFIGFIERGKYTQRRS
jgi:hypothetical protein